MDWHKHKTRDGNIDLLSALEEAIPIYDRTVAFGDARSFLEDVANFQPIGSRQAAAIALAQAVRIAHGHGL